MWQQVIYLGECLWYLWVGLSLFTNPGNNKQDVSLSLAIVDETILAAIKSYYPNRRCKLFKPIS